MGGYIGPLGEISSYDIGVVDVIKSVFVALVLYGIFGGFIILLIFGAVSVVLGVPVLRMVASFPSERRCREE